MAGSPRPSGLPGKVPAVRHGLNDWSSGVFASNSWILIRAFSVLFVPRLRGVGARYRAGGAHTPIFRGESMPMDRSLLQAPPGQG